VQPWPKKATTKESNELLKICNNCRIQHQHWDSKLSTHTNKALDFEKWVDLLLERAMAYYNLASVEAVTSVPKAVNTFHDQGSEDVRDHDKELIDRLALPLDNISEPD